LRIKQNTKKKKIQTQPTQTERGEDGGSENVMSVLVGYGGREEEEDTEWRRCEDKVQMSAQ